MHVPWYVNSATQGGSSTCHLSFQDCFRHQAGYKSSGTEVLQTTSWDFLGWLTHTHPPPLTIQVNILVFLIGKENEERGWAKMIMSVSRKPNQLTGVSSWRTRNMHKNQDLRQGMPKKWQPGANYWEMNQESHHELWRGFDLQLDLDLAAKGYMSVEETRCTFQQLQMLELFFSSFHANPCQPFFLRRAPNSANRQALHCTYLPSSIRGYPHVQRNNHLRPGVFIHWKAQDNFHYTTIISQFYISSKTFTWDY